jgi:hypothetical protein
MPLKPSITDAAEIVIRGHFISNNQPYNTTMGAFKTGMTQADLQAVCDAAVTEMAILASAFSAIVHFDTCDAKSVDHAKLFGATAAMDVLGTASGSPKNPAYCKCFALKTAISERYGDGRMYLGGQTSVALTNDWDASYIPAKVTLMKNTVVSLGGIISTGGMIWSVLSYKKQVATAITSVVAPNDKVNFRTQRSEGL